MSSKVPSAYDFESWSASAIGSVLARAETEAFRDVLTSRYYPYAIQFGNPEFRVLDQINCRHGVQLGLPGSALQHCDVVSSAKAVPFSSQTFDLVILPHSLDFTPDPVLGCVIPTA